MQATCRTPTKNRAEWLLEAAETIEEPYPFSSSTAPTTLRVVASAVTEPTLNIPTTPAQLTEMIASAVATALTNQQPVNRDSFNTAASGLISNASIGKHNQLPTRLSSGVACQTPRQIIISGRPQY